MTQKIFIGQKFFQLNQATNFFLLNEKYVKIQKLKLNIQLQNIITKLQFHERNMKVKLKAVLKTTHTLFQPFDDNQIVFQAGKTLTIKQFYKPSCQFIHLSKQLVHLYSFKPTPNKQGCFVAEKLPQQKIYISLYSFKKQRKTVCLSDSPQFFPSNVIDCVQLLIDEFDSHLVYGYAKAGNDSCIFLIDFNKLKIVSIGFVSSFNDIKVNAYQNLTLAFCHGNSIQTAKVYNGFWETDQKIFKKLGNINIIKHEIFQGEILLLCTKNQMYLTTLQSQVLQTINVFQNNEDEIHDVIKLNRALLILSKKQKMKVFVQDNDQLTYLYKGQVHIKLNQSQKIMKLALSANFQQVLLRTSTNEVFVWKVQDLQNPNDIKFQFLKVQNAMIGDKKGTVSLASGKQTALLASDNKISVWDLQRNVSLLQNIFNKFDKQSQKALYASALNPDGNSLICAFQDKIKIYKILLTKLRFIAEFNIKKCSQFVYSHGGQYVACKYGKGSNSLIAILNTLQMTQITSIKTHGEPNFILWNEMDDELIVCVDSTTITTYKVSEHSKSHSVKIPAKVNMVRIDYSTKRILVSTDKQIFIVNKDEIQKSIEPKFPKFNFIYPLHGVYFVATKDGNLYWSHQMSFQNYHEMPIFINQPFNIMYRNGYMLAFSSFQNITIVECIRQNLPAKKQLLKTSQDIVFVQIDEINRFFQKIKNLESSLENLQNATALKIQEEKTKYQKSLQQNSYKFQQEIAYLQKRYNEVHGEKIKQEKQNSRVFQQLESGQIKSVNDLQKMYDRKLRLQKQKCLEMQQKNVEQKIHYQKVIYELQKRYHDDIVKIREQYSSKLSQQYKRIEEAKKNDIEYKKKMQYKLISVEEQSEMTLFEVQKMKDEQIQQLRKRIVFLEHQQNSNKVEFHNEINTYKKMKDEYDQVKDELKKHKEKLAQAYERIKLLESEVGQKNKMVEEKNNIISQQDHQIGGLQKAKYVLSFRTTQIRKQLEPKQSLIDKLKQQMFKLEQEFKQEKKKSFQLNQKMQKVQKINKILKEQNVQFGIKLKNKERLHHQMSGEIFTIVNQMDQKQWPPALVKFYQTYIKEDNFKNMKKKSKDATSQEINRHLIHVEQSLLQVTAGNKKLLKAKDLDTKRKMNENAQLIHDFNKRKKSYQQQIEEYKNKITKLEKQIQDITRGSTRANTAKSTRRAISREKTTERGELSNLDFSFKKQSQIYLEKRQIPTRESRSRASSSGYRTMVLRSDKKQSSRFFDMAKQLENAKYRMQKQQKMIEQLNQRLLQQSLE